MSFAGDLWGPKEPGTVSQVFKASGTAIITELPKKVAIEMEGTNTLPPYK